MIVPEQYHRDMMKAETKLSPAGNQELVNWDAIKFKSRLWKARIRIKMIRERKSNEIHAARRLVAQHLAHNEGTLARNQGEAILRGRTSIETFDVVVTIIDRLIDSNTIFSVQRDFHSAPHDLMESVASIIYASTRLNFPELQVTTQMFSAHFGPHIVDPLLRLEGPHISLVNKMLTRNLSGGTPDGYLVLEELSKIAAEHQISWIPPPEDFDVDHHGGHDPCTGYPQDNDHPPSPSAPPPGDADVDFGILPLHGHVPNVPPKEPPFDPPLSEASAPSDEPERKLSRVVSYSKGHRFFGGRRKRERLVEKLTRLQMWMVGIRNW